MNTPLISVIIPCYNRADVVEKAINSALAQTYQNLEIIIVDDASTDNLAGILKIFTGNERIRVIRNTTNQGAGESRNVGVQAARGEYIAFLDSDDEWLPEKLERQWWAMQAAPRIPLSFSGVFLHKSLAAPPLTRIPRKTHASWLVSMLMGQGFCPGTTLMMQKSAFLKIGKLLPLKRLEDIEWLIRYFLKYDELVVVDAPLAHINPSGSAKTDDIIESASFIYKQHVHALCNTNNLNALATWCCVETSAAYARDKAFGKLFMNLISILHKPAIIYLMQKRICQKLRQM